MAELPHNKIQQKIFIVEENGDSKLMTGDLGDNRYGSSKEGVLPPYLSLGWKVIRMTPFSQSTKIAVLIEKIPEI